MDKKWLWFLLGIAIPCLLNLIFYFEVIPSSLSSNSWLGFWGGYLGGLATLAAFFLSNKTTKLIVLRQWEEKKFVEYKNSLLDNLKLFNTVEILNGISNVSFDALDEKIEIITKKKQEIYSCDIAFRTISMVDFGNVTKEEKQYYNYWQRIITDLSQFLDQQLDLISFCKNYKSDVEMLGLSQKQERNPQRHAHRQPQLFQKQPAEEIRQIPHAHHVHHGPRADAAAGLPEDQPQDDHVDQELPCAEAHPHKLAQAQVHARKGVHSEGAQPVGPHADANEQIARHHHGIPLDCLSRFSGH